MLEKRLLFCTERQEYSHSVTFSFYVRGGKNYECYRHLGISHLLEHMIFRGGNGIKIGYTKASGRTLAASAQRDGKELICVVMGAPNWFNDAYTLMEYGFKRLEE